MNLTSIRNIFNVEVNSEKANSRLWSGAVNQHRPLAELPLILQQYLHNCGYNGDEDCTWYKINWKQAWLKMAPGKSWSPLVCEQYNFLPIPSRIVYMKTRLFGLLPFEARDKYQNGYGNMLVKLMRMFTVTDAKGTEMDEAELVTILAEAVLLPLYMLQNYISWQVINTTIVKGTIHDKGKKVSGTFYFNAFGEFIAFETFDRYYSLSGKYLRMRWTAHADSYVERNGIRFPASFRAVWHLPDGNYEYFKGTIEDIESDAEKFENKVEENLSGQY